MTHERLHVDGVAETKSASHDVVDDPKHVRDDALVLDVSAEARARACCKRGCASTIYSDCSFVRLPERDPRTDCWTVYRPTMHPQYTRF